VILIYDSGFLICDNKMNMFLSKALLLLATSLFCADMCVASKRFDMDGDQTRKRAREAPAQTPPGTGFNHDLSGAENSGPAVKIRRVDARFDPVEGEEASPESFSLFADLPTELQLLIFSKLEDQQTMLKVQFGIGRNVSSRAVNRRS